MATKRILKSVNIKKAGMAKGLVSALVNAENKSSKDVVLARSLEEVRGEDIKSLFGSKLETNR